MSDIFDHNLDAWEDNMPGGRSYEEGYESDWAPDPLYYHMRIKYKMIGETESHFHIEFSELPVWVPKKIVRSIKPDTMFVHTNTFKKILAKAIEEHKSKK